MRTITIRGAKCVPCPIDGKNINDCWEELFQGFTDCVIGSYHNRKGVFAFCMGSEDASMFTFEHFRGSNYITFNFHDDIQCTSTDIFLLRIEMEQICEYCHEATGVNHHVRFSEWRDNRNGQDKLYRLDVSFYVEID